MSTNCRAAKRVAEDLIYLDAAQSNITVSGLIAMGVTPSDARVISDITACREAPRLKLEGSAQLYFALVGLHSIWWNLPVIGEVAWRQQHQT